METLGTRIREIRLKKGLTQIELAQGICTASMISQVESNRARPSYKMLAQVANRLEVSLEKLLSDVNMNLKAESVLKMARAMVKARQFAAVIPLLHELLDAPYGTGLRMELMFDLAESYLNIGSLDEAEKWLDEIRQLAIKRQESHALIRVSLHLGQIFMERKQYQLAVYQWKQALDELDKSQVDDVVLRESVLFRLGQGNTKLGKIKESIGYYQLAMDAGKGSDNLNQLGMLFMELAQSYKRLNNLEQSISYSERAAHVYETLERFAMKTMLEVDCAIVYGQTGREQEAVDMLQQAITKFQELGKQTDVGVAFVELARVELKLGQLDQAEQHCQLARTLLPELHQHQAWVNRLLGQIALLQGYRQEAIRRFERAADCFKSMEQVDDWEQTMYDLSRLYEDEQKPERALQVLKSMRSFTRKVLEERGIVL